LSPSLSQVLPGCLPVGERPGHIDRMARPRVTWTKDLEHEQGPFGAIGGEEPGCPVVPRVDPAHQPGLPEYVHVPVVDVLTSAFDLEQFRAEPVDELV